MAEEQAKTGSSPYSTAGGGVRLEQEIAAAALASLLLGQPVEGLGDEFTPSEVALQQEAQSPVDDVVLRGVSSGGERALRMACRRRPTLGKSDESTVKLFADYIQVVLDSGPAIESGSLRLGLAVAGPFGPATELADLTEVARRQPSRASFEAAVVAPGAHTAGMRARLTNIDELVDAALTLLQRSGDAKKLSWALLRGLFVIQTQFEGDAAPGRTNVVARLQVLTGDAARAEALRLRLVEITSQAAIRAGSITRPMLRRELRPFGPLGASPDFAAAQSQITLLESELQRRTQRSLPASGLAPAFTLGRALLLADLVQRISAAPAGTVILVRGEPDVGKSALTLAAIDSIRASGGTALAMSLRDLPPSAVNLKGALGLGPRELLAAAPSAPVTVLLLDGAEVVQERETSSLGALLDAAMTVGMTAVLVARDDAVGTVREALKARGISRPYEFPVGALSDEEIQAVVGAFPELNRLRSDPRALWLLRRLGLVELLLQAANRGSGMPETLSSEAEVFAAVWSSLIRQNERVAAGISPDDRAAALTGIARQLLTGGTGSAPLGAALASLRSDGVLLPQDRSAAWRAGDVFISDVIRDFATARLLIRDGLQALIASSAPRWAIRATRLYAQARLADAAAGSEGSVAACWSELRSTFAELSVAHGARWAELPWEALLTAGWADQALAQLTPGLISDGAARIEAIRCLKLRFTHAGACDPLVGAPLVSWMVVNGLFGHAQSYGEDPVGDLVLSWLRGVSRAEVAGKDVAAHRPLRARVRQELLNRGHELGPKAWLECLGLLGSESNDATAAALRTIAKEKPHVLASVVESLDVAAALSKQDIALLADLTEAYYIEKPSDISRTSHIQDEGIRRHEGGGWGVPLAAWYRGPFLQLLRADLSRGLQVVNRMHDRGARDRIKVLAGLRDASDAQRRDDGQDEGLYLDLLGSGRRVFVGDAHVWLWYRGSGVGPYPCMSALFCLEMVLDELVKLEVPLRTLAEWVLRNATTLATPGLILGFFVRHLEKVTDELDGFLAAPGAWRLEFSRALAESSIHVQGPDRADLVGYERRRRTLRDVASHLVLSAAQRRDSSALERLGAVGRQLLVAAGGENAPPEVRLWAAHLDWKSYSIEEHGDYQVVELKPPEEVVQALAPAQAKSENVFAMYGLMNRYRPRAVTPYRVTLAEPQADQLANDFSMAQRLQVQLSQADSELDLLRMALAGVAAALLDAAFHGLLVPEQSLPWALSVLVDCATNPYLGDFPTERAVFPDGSDRKAALALPLALSLMVRRQTTSDTSLDLGEAERDFRTALTAGTTSLFLEVRHNAAEGLRAILGQPCSQMPDGGCWHEWVWDAIEAGARSVVLGVRSDYGRREIEPITGDLVDELANRQTKDLMLTHITPPAICVLEAARSNTCLRARAERLRGALLEAYIRAACFWAANHYDWSEEQHNVFVSAVLRSAADVTPTLLIDLANRLQAAPEALGDFLHAVTVVATYEADSVRTLAAAWPQLMGIGLASVHGKPRRYQYELGMVVRNLVPDPSPSAYMGDVDATVKAARASWIGVEAVSANIEEWLQVAGGREWCVDALVGFLQAQRIEQQANPGLIWVRSLVVDGDGTARTSGFLLIEWLRELRDSHILASSSWRDYRAIVDALVLTGFSGAHELQQRDE